MEAEVFLQGIWKNYDELEESLSMPELLATLEAMREAKWKDYKFQAAMQGVSLPDSPASNETRTFEEIKRDAMIRAQGGDPTHNDIVNLTGQVAVAEGFGVNIEEGVVHNTY
jgi:hypothetical protein